MVILSIFLFRVLRVTKFIIVHKTRLITIILSHCIIACLILHISKINHD